MKKIFFATTNEGKLNEVRSILGLDVIGTPLEIDEIQSLDPVKVATKKAQAYFERLKKPIFVEDVSLSIESLDGLPGTYIDAFMKTLGNDGIADMMKDKKDRRATAQATVVYVSKKGKEEIFIGKVEGTISDRPRGKGFGWDPIFIPKGETRTFGEMTQDEKNRYSMRAKALNKFKSWLNSKF
ncbi:non-canonical purine NTP pyrophosphatase, RdgB/HAM1 family [Candidatus Woesebacteria bacterium RIFCSPHIGHO2_01_FULL_38_9]|uniref:Non-canonical purine NTP pyrophosphatase, RdgB/HAM1 family n=2 Tax=Candidatus Woeseibacteriota TaxID=1752722 RepID=A0A1F7Y2V4_9BACT|nr:MAG: non-canonical purine NTP pyrophosphatase, RdgB/HAM1 family [Candidatus Woesebacteria bacterium RIFCSPHIGHO2_01_FULL_38_9]OGM58302.1 MAG: non-canonical purine NTP pyrophosphatase, RdgB/HAM1 family [Candidatus Woesebacteria bacterium RIFCSPLOWO2_01_FULL_39_10]